MEDQHPTSNSPTPTRIQTKVCPCGNVYLYVGHTCVYLRQEEFLDLAQIIHAAENLMCEQQGTCASERQH